ncbi:hypothetical protein RRSWK_01502 [Rhodopirellula sp. SWK7]|nr:hypothetical protein RRSWK_01502 [Rhodopirellula sp. SWK7]
MIGAGLTGVGVTFADSAASGFPPGVSASLQIAFGQGKARAIVKETASNNFFIDSFLVYRVKKEGHGW